MGWLASNDILEAYHSLEIREADRDLLQFISQGQRYRFKVLPNGLSSGPRIFTKVMKAVMSHLRRKYNILLCFYIDDTIIIGRMREEKVTAVSLTLELLIKLGFTINRTKSALQPEKEQIFLGFRINTVLLKVDIPQAKCHKLIQFVREVLADETLKI